MTEQEHVTGTPTIVVGTVIGLVLAAVFTWLFALFADLSVTSGAAILAFVLLGAWTIAGAVMYGAPEDAAEAH